MSLISSETLARKAQALVQALGPTVTAALAEPDVVEVWVNPDGAIWLERLGGGRSPAGASMTPADAERVLRLVADHAGEVITRDTPLIAARLPTGERVQGVVGPVATAPSFVIRKRPDKIYALETYVAERMMSPLQAERLRAAATRRENILIAGGAGSGKTTLANALLALPAFAGDRVILIEDTPELQCASPDRLELQTRPADPVITMADLVRAAMRLRPDRIVIGEVRDASALDLLKAWNTGHPGGLATLHANSAAETLTRLEDLIAEAIPAIPRRAIGQAVDLIAFLRRGPRGPVLETLARVEGWDHDGGYRLVEVGCETGRQKPA